MSEPLSDSPSMIQPVHQAAPVKMIVSALALMAAWFPPSVSHLTVVSAPVLVPHLTVVSTPALAAMWLPPSQDFLRRP